MVRSTRLIGSVPVLHHMVRLGDAEAHFLEFQRTFLGQAVHRARSEIDEVGPSLQGRCELSVEPVEQRRGFGGGLVRLDRDPRQAQPDQQHEARRRRHDDAFVGMRVGHDGGGRGADDAALRLAGDGDGLQPGGAARRDGLHGLARLAAPRERDHRDAGVADLVGTPPSRPFPARHRDRWSTREVEGPGDDLREVERCPAAHDGIVGIGGHRRRVWRLGPERELFADHPLRRVHAVALCLIECVTCRSRP